MNYFIAATAIFAVNAAWTFVTRKVDNRQTLITFTLFPICWIATGMAVSGLGMQLASALVFYGLGWMAIKKLGWGGGVARAIALAALWIPLSETLLTFLWLTPIVGALLGVALAKIEGTKEIEHYAAIILACCAGVMAYDAKNHPAYPTTDKVVEQTVDPLRGLSNP